MGSPLCICDGYGKPGYNSAKTRGVEPFCLLCRDEILGLMHHLGSAHIGMHNLYSALGALQSNLYVLLVGLINIQSHTSVFPVYSTMIFIYIYIYYRNWCKSLVQNKTCTTKKHTKPTCLHPQTAQKIPAFVPELAAGSSALHLPRHQLPSREPTYPTLGKGTSSSKVPWEGIWCKYPQAPLFATGPWKAYYTPHLKF